MISVVDINLTGVFNVNWRLKWSIFHEIEGRYKDSTYNKQDYQLGYSPPPLPATVGSNG